jgi:hypothetical protein
MVQPPMCPNHQKANEERQVIIKMPTGLRMIRWRVRWYWYVVAIGPPPAIHGLTVLLNQAAGVDIPRQGFSSIAGLLLIFGVRLINPLDGPIGEEPGWRGFALPGLQATRSPLVSTAILGVLVTIWHLPLFLFSRESASRRAAQRPLRPGSRTTQPIR